MCHQCIRAWRVGLEFKRAMAHLDQLAAEIEAEQYRNRDALDTEA